MNYLDAVQSEAHTPRRAPEQPTPPPSVAPGGRSPEEIQRLKARAKDDARQAITSKIHNRDRADQTPYLVHLTKSEKPFRERQRTGVLDNEVAHLRFENMLRTRQVQDCELPHVSTDNCRVRAVCFSEATSLECHAKKYSPWGLAFTKSFLYNARKANPVLYCRPEILRDMKERYKDQADYLRYLTPMSPMYADENQMRVGNEVYVKEENSRQQDWSEILREGTYWVGKIVSMNRDTYEIKPDDHPTRRYLSPKMVKLAYKAVDYTHEREWRTPGPVAFEWENLHCVYVPSVRLLNRLLPELYQDLTAAHVQIVELTPTFEKNDCHHGYECFSWREGEECGPVWNKRNHTLDQSLFFEWEKSKRMRRCPHDRPGRPCRHVDCTYAHVRDRPTCPNNLECNMVGCPYVHTRDEVKLATIEGFAKFILEICGENQILLFKLPNECLKRDVNLKAWGEHHGFETVSEFIQALPGVHLEKDGARGGGWIAREAHNIQH